MTDLDRFLYLIRKGYVDGLDESETKEHASLYEKLKKAEEFWTKMQTIFPIQEWNSIDNLVNVWDIFLQNQITLDDIEKIKRWDKIFELTFNDKDWSLEDSMNEVLK